MGIKPDITALAKIIGGGFPVGAVAGTDDVMEVFGPQVGAPGPSRRHIQREPG